MPNTLTYGQKIPLDGEKGTWWDNLEDNFTRLDGHAHDGVTSPVISTANLNKQVVSIASASWAAVAGNAGTYSQEITNPTGITHPKVSITFVINGGSRDGEMLLLSHKAGSTTAKTIVYINDNTLDIKAVYA
jgi:hypothetical protein